MNVCSRQSFQASRQCLDPRHANAATRTSFLAKAIRPYRLLQSWHPSRIVEKSYANRFKSGPNSDQWQLSPERIDPSILLSDAVRILLPRRDSHLGRRKLVLSPQGELPLPSNRQ